MNSEVFKNHLRSTCAGFIANVDCFPLCDHLLQTGIFHQHQYETTLDEHRQNRQEARRSLFILGFCWRRNTHQNNFEMYGRLLGIQSRRLYFPNSVHRNYLKPQLRTVLYCLFVPNFALGESLIIQRISQFFLNASLLIFPICWQSTKVMCSLLIKIFLWQEDITFNNYMTSQHTSRTSRQYISNGKK